MSYQAGDRINFPDGWSIYVHAVKDDQVFFQTWPPGINFLGLVENAARMPVKDFEAQVEIEHGTKQEPVDLLADEY